MNDILETSFFRQKIAELVKTDMADINEFEGCTEEEINKLEKDLVLPSPLPQSYRNFLKIMGKRSGPYMAGSDVTYKYLFDLKKWAAELLEEDGNPVKLPSNAFVFYMHQGYYFKYFCLDGNTNPIVYSYHQEEQCLRREDTLSSYFMTEFSSFFLEETEFDDDQY